MREETWPDKEFKLRGVVNQRINELARYSVGIFNFKIGEKKQRALETLDLPSFDSY
jgi:hypothetical protein